MAPVILIVRTGAGTRDAHPVGGSTDVEKWGMGQSWQRQRLGADARHKLVFRVRVQVMETGIPIFHQVVVTIVVAENDTPIWLQIERSNPAILAPQLLWLSTESWTGLTSPRRLFPACATKNTSKNKKERNQNCR